ncbi:MAG: hypothetical protein ABIU63_08635 [Chitinophagaceae bacterium]
MKAITYTSGDIDARIAQLEARALEQEEDLKNTAKQIMHDLKPINLIKGAFSSTIKSPGFGKNVFKGALGLAAGFLSKKIFVMGSSNIVKKALGTVVELGVAKVVSSKANKITETGIKMINKATR